MEFINKIAPYLLIAVVLLAIYKLYVSPQRKIDRKFADGVAALKQGDEIITLSGVFAKVSEAHEDYVIIEVIPSGILMKIKPQGIAVFPEELKKAEEAKKKAANN